MWAPEIKKDLYDTLFLSCAIKVLPFQFSADGYIGMTLENPYVYMPATPFYYPV